MLQKKTKKKTYFERDWNPHYTLLYELHFFVANPLGHIRILQSRDI